MWVMWIVHECSFNEGRAQISQTVSRTKAATTVTLYLPPVSGNHMLDAMDLLVNFLQVLNY
jgi:hypothetical protein